MVATNYWIIYNENISVLLVNFVFDYRIRIFAVICWNLGKISLYISLFLQTVLELWCKENMQLFV